MLSWLFGNKPSLNWMQWVEAWITFSSVRLSQLEEHVKTSNKGQAEMSAKFEELKTSLENYISKVNAKVQDLQNSVKNLQDQLSSVTSDADLQSLIDNVAAADAQISQ